MRLIDSRNMGRGKHGWLDSYFHFSFAEYYNPGNMQFGVLRVLNDDTVAPGTGFGPHAHADMEILSYVIDGELTHADSMGNKRTLTRGQVQYMSAGTGVGHSEYNHGKRPLRFLQIWILPDRKGYAPQYGEHRFAFTDRINNWLPIATGVQNSQSTAPIEIHADINVYATSVGQGQHMEFSVPAGRQAYLVMIEGQATINGTGVSMRDAAEIVEESISIHPESTAHMLIIEMTKA